MCVCVCVSCVCVCAMYVCVRVYSVTILNSLGCSAQSLCVEALPVEGVAMIDSCIYLYTCDFKA